MKKILSCVMALSIAACAAMSASAEVTTQKVSEDKGTSAVNLSINNGDETYTVEIPAGEMIVTAGGGPQSLGTLKVDEDMMLKHGATLNVTVDSQNDWNLQCEKSTATHEHAYSYELINEDTSSKIEEATPIISLDENADVATDGTVNLAIDKVTAVKPDCAGTYADTLTFTVNVAEAE